MALDDIKKAIEQETQNRIAEINSQWEQRLAIAKAEWEEKIAAKRDSILSAAKHRTNQKIQQSEFKLNSSRQAEVLKTKQKIMTDVFNQAEQNLAKLEDAQYIDLMVKLIDKLPDIKGELISVKDKQELLKKAAKKSKRDFKVVEKTINGRGGFVFHSNDLDIDQTFTSLINQVKDSAAVEISKIIFA